MGILWKLVLVVGLLGLSGHRSEISEMAVGIERHALSCISWEKCISPTRFGVSAPAGNRPYALSHKTVRPATDVGDLNARSLWLQDVIFGLQRHRNGKAFRYSGGALWGQALGAKRRLVRSPHCPPNALRMANCASRPDLVCRTIPCILEDKPNFTKYLKLAIFEAVAPFHLKPFDNEPGSGLGDVRLLGDIVRPPRGLESHKYQSNAYQTGSHADNRGNAHMSGPSRSNSLGLKIVFVAFALASGLAFLVYASYLFIRGERGASIFYYYVASLGVIFGAVFGRMLIYDLSGFGAVVK